jgi:hypothetical protein
MGDSGFWFQKTVFGFRLKALKRLSAVSYQRSAKDEKGILGSAILNMEKKGQNRWDGCHKMRDEGQGARGLGGNF